MLYCESASLDIVKICDVTLLERRRDDDKLLKKLYFVLEIVIMNRRVLCPIISFDMYTNWRH